MTDHEPTIGQRIALRYADRVAGWRGLADEIDEAVREAVAAEREACKKPEPTP